MKPINLAGLPPEALLVIATMACNSLVATANHLTTDEGDPDDTEEEFGLEIAEVVEFAHDDMIFDARHTLENIQIQIDNVGR